MTEYELTAILHAVLGNVIAVQGLFFSAITAYLIVAYLVGAKLSRAQVSIVTVVFSLFCFLLLGSITRLSGEIGSYRQQIQSIDSGLNEFASPGPGAFAVLAIFALAYLMSLIFMAQIRRRARSGDK
jgi:hypothetical protein